MSDTDPRADRAAIDPEEAVWLSADFPDDAERLAGLRAQVEEAIGVDLIDVPEPHGTLLFIGPIDDADMEALQAEVADAVAGLDSFEVAPDAIESFPPGDDGRTAIIVRIRSEEMDALHQRLMAALAPRITATQFPEFKAHLTLGYAPSGTEVSELPEVSADPLQRVDRVVIRRGGEEIGAASLEGPEEVDIRARMPILKIDTDRRLITGVVLEPWDGDPETAADQQDSQRDVVRAEVIEEACHAYLRKFNKGTTLTLMHDDSTEAPLELCECWIARNDILFDDTLIRKGTWLMTLYVAGDDEWELVKRGDLDGLSFGGTGRRRPIVN